MKKIKILLFLLLILFLCPSVNFGFTGIGISGEEVSFPDIQSSLDVSNGFVVSEYQGTYYMCVLPSSDSYFYQYIGSGSYMNKLHCSKTAFLEYKSTGGDWTYNRSYHNSTNPSLSDIIYSSVNIYSDVDKTGFYYEVPEIEEEYVFPYIANTDEDLIQVEDTGYLLIMPRFCT